jgi:hypothetical protein
MIEECNIFWYREYSSGSPDKAELFVRKGREAAGIE